MRRRIKVKELCDIKGCSNSAVYRAIRKGIVKICGKEGNKFLVQYDEEVKSWVPLKYNKRREVLYGPGGMEYRADLMGLETCLRKHRETRRYKNV